MAIYHYPPDIMNLLVDTIPRLNKSKKDVLLFFKGTDIPNSIIQPLETIVNKVMETGKDMRQFFRISLSNSQINKKSNAKVDIFTLNDLDLSV